MFSFNFGKAFEFSANFSQKLPNARLPLRFDFFSSKFHYGLKFVSNGYYSVVDFVKCHPAKWNIRITL